MENNVIGDKSVFAIEYGEIEFSGLIRYCVCGLWLAGKRMGDVHSPIFVDTFLASLRGLDLAKPTLNVPEKWPATAQDLLNMMQGEGLPEAAAHYFLAIEGFDDFLKLYFKSFQATTFIWAIHPDSATLEPYLDYLGDVYQAEVPNVVLSKVIADFTVSLNSQ